MPEPLAQKSEWELSAARLIAAGSPSPRATFQAGGGRDGAGEHCLRHIHLHVEWRTWIFMGAAKQPKARTATARPMQGVRYESPPSPALPEPESPSIWCASTRAVSVPAARPGLTVGLRAA